MGEGKVLINLGYIGQGEADEPAEAEFAGICGRPPQTWVSLGQSGDYADSGRLALYFARSFIERFGGLYEWGEQTCGIGDYLLPKPKPEPFWRRWLGRSQREPSV